MELPFPGMDPFLEAPEYWRSFHHHLPEEIMTQLNINNEALPTLPVPLLPPDPDTMLDMGEVIAEIYRRAVYGRRIDYSQPIPPPALRSAVAAWWAEQISQPES